MKFAVGGQMSLTEQENRQTMETKDTCLCEERFIDRSILVSEILKGEGKGALCATPAPTPPPPPPPPLWLHKPHKPMANRVQLILCVIFVSGLLSPYLIVFYQLHTIST